MNKERYFYRLIKGKEKSFGGTMNFKNLIAAMQTCYDVKECSGRYYAGDGENKCIEVVKLKNGIELRKNDWKDVIIKGSSDGQL